MLLLLYILIATAFVPLIPTNIDLEVKHIDMLRQIPSQQTQIPSDYIPGEWIYGTTNTKASFTEKEQICATPGVDISRIDNPKVGELETDTKTCS